MSIHHSTGRPPPPSKKQRYTSKRWAAWLWSTASVLGGVACGPEKTPDGATSSGPHVEIVTPQDHAAVSGWASLEVEVTGETGKETLEWSLDGNPIPLKTPSLGLDIKTSAYEDGTHTVAVTLSDVSGVVSRDEVALDFTNPGFELLSYRVGSDAYANTDQLDLTLEYSRPGLRVSADMSGLDTDFRESSVSVRDLGEGKYQLSYPISGGNAASDGTHSVKVRAEDDQGKSTTDLVDIRLRQTKPMPFSIASGIYIDSPLPEYPIDLDLPSPALVDLPVPLVSGTTKTIGIEWGAPVGESVDRILVAVDGMHGYYVVPVAPGSDRTDLNLQGLKPGVDGLLNVEIVPISASGTTSGAEEITVEVVNVGVDGMQITLFWDAPVDLDLSVVDPQKNVIDYSSPSVNGGMLTFDANALCSIGSTFAENIAWNSGEALLGDYEIHVQLSDHCGYEGPIHWWIVGTAASTSNVQFKPGAGGAGSTTNVSGGQAGGGTGGNGVKYYGTIQPNDAAASNVGGIVAGPPVVAEPAQTVGGTIWFKKNPKGTFLEERARFVQVQAVSAADPTVPLGQATTDENGVYSMQLKNPQNLAYKLLVEAAYSIGGAATSTLVVTDHARDIHSASTPQFDAKPNTTTRLDFVIMTDNNAGAFNILDNLRKGDNWVRSQWANAPLGPLAARWERGVFAATEYSQGGQSVVGFCGSTDDPDEFDDSVIVHEFNHHVYHEVLGRDAPGGGHDFNRRLPAGLAFSEGLATAISQHVLQSSVYIDKTQNNTSVGRTNIENDGRSVAKGQDPNGDVNEILVSMVLWDLFDGIDASAEPHDMLGEERLSAGAFLLGLKGRTNRGAPNVDLVDYLDAWRCRSTFNIAGDGLFHTELKEILDERSYVYDFKPTTFCP